MDTKIPMTEQGYRALQEELQQLKNIERPAIIQAIAEAREHGDLSENAEYHSAREKQSMIEGRILDIEDKTSRAEVINPADLSGSQVKFGAHIHIVDCDNDEESTYQIVGEHEADISKNLLSISAPLARALISKEIGDVVEFASPRGTKTYEILDVIFK